MKNSLMLVLAIVALLVSTATGGTYSGGTGEPNDPYRIATPEDMQQIGANPSDWDKHFVLVNDVNLAGYTGAQFNIIATDRQNPFTGVFDGNDHKVWNFTWDSNVSILDISGLFGWVGSGGQIKNLGMENVKVNAIGGLGVGGLVGYNDYGSTITNCYVTGSVSGYSGVGGLVGYNNGTITNCYSTASVSGEGAVGGLVGLDFGGTILNCYATSTVTGGDDIGGLIGAAGTVLSGPSISSSFASGTIAGNAHIGGLVGIIEGGEILDCYATVDIDGNDCIGGLIGCFCGTTISYCYSSGKVSGDANTGGFVGYFVGCESYPPGSYLGCFWDSNVNPDVNGIGNTSNPNVVGKPTAEMKTKSTFTDAGWDFLEIWLINNGATYPILRQEIRCDLNGDGFINLLDFAILASHWLEGGK